MLYYFVSCMAINMHYGGSIICMILVYDTLHYNQPNSEYPGTGLIRGYGNYEMHNYNIKSKNCTSSPIGHCDMELNLNSKERREMKSPRF